MTPYAVLPKFYNQLHFFSQILHTRVINKGAHVYHF